MREVKSPTLGRFPEEARTLRVLYGWQWQGARKACVGRVFRYLLAEWLTEGHIKQPFRHGCEFCR